MDLDSLTCICGRCFQCPGGLSHHQRKCQRTRRELSGILSKAKALWAAKQAKRKELAELSCSNTRGKDYSRGANNVPAVLTGRQHEEEPKAERVQMNSSSSQTNLKSMNEGLASGRSIAERRTRRTIRQPARLRDMVPHPPSDESSSEESEAEVSEVEQEPTSTDEGSNSGASDEVTEIHPVFRLPKDQFGVFRQYYSVFHALHDPDRRRKKNLGGSHHGTNKMRDKSGGRSDEKSDDVSTTSGDLVAMYEPYPSKTSFLLGEWYWGRKQKSRQDFSDLIRILTDSDFNLDDVRNTSWANIDRSLGSSDEDTIWPDGVDAGWIQEELEIEVPFHRRQSDGGAVLYRFGYFFRRNLVSIIREMLSSTAGRLFHFDPVELFWCQQEPSGQKDRPPLRLYAEIYNSPAFGEAYRDLQESPREPKCDLPRSVIALMLCSDETHLTQFGKTTLWSLYVSFGNISKYVRWKPDSRQCHHVAYFASLPEQFDEFVKEHTGKGPTDSLSTFCNREAYHAQWKSILDDEFLDAYAHGFVFDCLDGQHHRLYPRILTLSTDYKEKTSLVCIRHLGTHPCPRCLVKLNDVHKLGTQEDRQVQVEKARHDDEEYRDTVTTARNQIFKERYAVKGAVDSILDEYSITPTETAFSNRLSRYGFDAFKATVVDPMHDIEQGHWRSLFKHLLRILHCHDKTQIIELDTRYRGTPAFGRDTIRTFRKNISEMKSLAARDFEDMLQCLIPAFDGLIPEPHNSQIIELLFIMAEWHGLAKLRLHSEASLNQLDNVTTELGAAMRQFQDLTCSAFNTEELPAEKDARKKRSKKLKKQTQDPGMDSNATTWENAQEEANTLPKTARKEYSLRTYKFHAIGHYVSNIRDYGTTDSFSTEMGELEHRRSKARYSRTNKKDFVGQLTATERREARLCRIRDRINDSLNSDDRLHLQRDLEEGTLLNDRYHLSMTQSSTANILDLLRVYHNDPAMKHFLPNLRLHCLLRVHDTLTDTSSESNVNSREFLGGHNDDLSVHIQYDRLYQHKVLRLNYTTYDLRREQDAINCDTSQCNIMVLRPTEDDTCTTVEAEEVSGPNPSSKYLYARVLMIFHVNIICTGAGSPSLPQRMDILWVRWYQPHLSTLPKRHHLDRLSFLPLNHEDAFGFINPRDVLRAAHIIPAFNMGKHPKAHRGNGQSNFARDKDDWIAYYVNRDMLMQHYDGLGVGHFGLTSIRTGVQSSIGVLEDSTAHEAVDDPCNGPYGSSMEPTNPFALPLNEPEECSSEDDFLESPGAASDGESDGSNVDEPLADVTLQTYLMYPN